MSAVTLTFLSLSCILLIAIVIFLVLAYSSQIKLDTCEGYPSSWCFDDWKCLDPKDSLNTPNRPDNQKTVINMSKLALFGEASVITRCGVLNEQTVKEFKYSDGVKNYVKYPEYEVNIWSLAPGCNPQNQNSCPRYTIGDIYWPACSGDPSSAWYTDPAVYKKLGDEAAVRRNNALRSS